MREALHTLVDLPESLERWVDDGLITPEQAERIRATEQTRGVRLPVTEPRGATPGQMALRPRPPSLLTEGLGYLGGVLILVASAVLVGRYWEQMPAGVRLGLPAVAAAALLGAGAGVPVRLGPAGRRMVAVLWLLSAVAFASFLSVGATDALGWDRAEDVAVLVGGGTAIYAAGLWARQRTALQQAVLLGAMMTTAGAGAAHLKDLGDGLPGLAVLGVGLFWLALAFRGLLPPQRAATVLGSVATLLGALITMTEGWGYFVALSTVAALLVAAVVVGDLVVLGIAAVGALLVLPGTLEYYFPGAPAAPLGLLAAGLVLVAAALRAIRRRDKRDRLP